MTNRLNAVPEENDDQYEGNPEDGDGDGCREPVIRDPLCLEQVHTDG